jgi:4-hydroxybenzoate polyprenyltransferase
MNRSPLGRLVQLLEMIRFSHTLFALPFALLAAAMAWSANARSRPPIAMRWQDMAGILICMVTARSAAMAFNRLADRRLDAANPRTQNRHLPQGVLGARTVALFTLICVLGFLASTLLFLPRNPLPLLAAVPLLAFLLAYSYAKRFTLLAHLWLGTALAMAPLGAWVALRAELALAPLLLGLAVMLWVTGFDIIYACQDVDFDRTMRLHSIPARFGVARALRIAAVCHFGMVLLLAALPAVFAGLGWIYATGVAGIAILLVYEHSLVSANDLTRVNRAFFHVNAVVSIGLFVVGVLDLWLRGKG